MKFIKKTIIPAIAFFGLSLTGCAGFLDTTPHDSLNSDNALESLQDFDYAANGVYEAMRSTSYKSVFNVMVPDAMSDNLILNRDGRQIYNEFADFKFYGDTYGVSGMWNFAYNAILSANEVITKIGGIPYGEEDKVTANNILAECLALRGMIHFDLVRWYGQDYKRASDTDLGVTYKDYTEVDFPARNTVKDVYKRLVEDLEKAKELMTDDYHANINYRLNKKSVAAILARVYLTMGNDQKAVENATEAIAGDGSDMANVTNFSRMYADMSSSEVLFRIAIKSDDDVLAGADWGQGDPSKYLASYSVSYELNELYNSKGDDCRKDLIKLVNSTSGPCNVVWKWVGSTTVNLTDIPVIRAAEMYLTRAEANYNLKNYEEALADLNLVKSKRYSDYTEGTESGTALENEIQLQRRLELAFEGHRFFDLKRRHEGVERDGKGFLADGTGTVANVQSVSADSPFYLLPIPQSELDANENMVQNKY